MLFTLRLVSGYLPASYRVSSGHETVDKARKHWSFLSPRYTIPHFPLLCHVSLLGDTLLSVCVLLFFIYIFLYINKETRTTHPKPPHPTTYQT
jgi:hypothetical protein